MIPAGPDPHDDRLMARALELARQAGARGEIPVGAVVARTHDEAGTALAEPEIVGEAGNAKELAQDPLGHAEILAIRAAARTLGRWRLSGCSLYVTLEPCTMCAGAIVHARVDRVVYGAVDPKAGAVESLYEILGDDRLNHAPTVVAGVRGEECAETLRAFFRSLRAKKAIGSIK